MRYSLLLAPVLLGLAGCVVSTPEPAPASTTYVSPAPPTTTYVTPTSPYAPPSTTTVIRNP
jgi:hypothetical protein